MKHKISLTLFIGICISFTIFSTLNFASELINTVKVNEMSNLIIAGALDASSPPLYNKEEISNGSYSKIQNETKSDVIIHNLKPSSINIQEADAYYTSLATQTFIDLYPNTPIDTNAILILKKALIEEDIVNNKIDSNDSYTDLDAKFKKGKLIGIFHVVGYCPCSKCCGKWSNSTASGAIPTVHHTISVDKKVIPLGTRIIIDGGETANVINYNGIYKAEDTGGGVKGNMIDIFRPTHIEAQKVSSSGKQYAYVYEAIQIQ